MGVIKRRSVHLGGAIVSLWFAASASAGLIIYEPFDYTPAGASITGQMNTYSTGSPTWNTAGTATAPVHQIANSSLTAPSGFPAAIGNGGDLRKTDLTEYARLNLPQQYGTNTTLYYSALVNVPDIAGLATPNTNANANNDVFIAFNNGTGASGTRPSIWAGALTIRQGLAPNTFNIGVRSTSTAAGTTYWSADLSPQNTMLMVVRYTTGPTAGTGGVSDLWINPSSATFGAAMPPSPDGFTIGNMNASAASDHVDSLIIGAGISNTATLGNPNQMFIDEIRVGDTWADVTSIVIPEPASVVLMLLLVSCFQFTRLGRKVL
jgi:hypothetical protein